MKHTLVFDIETHSADLLYAMPPSEFVRLIGYRWVGHETVLTTDLEELREQIRSARLITGHNIHDFDLRAVFGMDSDEPLEMTMEGRVYDTWTHAILVNPAPYSYTDRNGKTVLAAKPEQMKRWFSLDNQAYQLGVSGKTHDLKALAKEFGGFGEIPVDEPRFREYLLGDISTSAGVSEKLWRRCAISKTAPRGSFEHYAYREQNIAARAAVISSNGIRVDTLAAEERVRELAERREAIMAGLREGYDFPSEGKAPWATTEGKEAIFAALADHGIKPGPDVEWPRTPTGNLQLGGQVLLDLTEGTEAEELGRALAELKGQRSLAQLALDCTHPDGKVHPEITMLQRSGRWSTTKPGLTVWTARGEGAVEKRYFLPDTDDEVLLEVDYSNADARVVAALSGDKRYAERFEPGADGHMINAIAAWGAEVVASDPKHYRQMAKPLGHGWSYGGQAKTLSKQAKVPLEQAKIFCDGMNATYSRLVAWQNAVRREARQGYVVNHWGRRMPVEKGREFTQAPALLGQSGTREIVCDALLRMPIHWLRRVKAQIHDALLFSVPKDMWEECRDYLVDLMADVLDPGGRGQMIDFPVEAGEAGANWYEAAH